MHEPLGRIVLEKNSTFFLFMSLFIAAAGPLMFGAEPFTMVFARKETPEILFAGMAAAYVSEKGGDFSGIIQFDITGDQAGWYYLDFREGRCDFETGRAENPGVTIHSPWDVWKAISNGSLSGQEAMMQGKDTVEGDLGLLMRTGDAFER